MLRDFFKSLKSGTEHLNYGRHIVASWASEYLYDESLKEEASDRTQILRILDLGCGHGTDLLNIKKRFEEKKAGSKKNLTSARKTILELHGIENYSPYTRECRAAGIKIKSINIEAQKYGSPGFDLIIANQVLEHTKEIFWIASEMARILKPGGRLIVGVPNLASLHNRLLLLFGQQPTAQLSLSAHVRTFTRRDLAAFFQAGGYFTFLRHAGSNFYPFGPALARPLARLLPSMAWGLFAEFERTDRKGKFLDILNEIELETPYLGGPANPVR